MAFCKILSEEKDVEALAPRWRELHARVALSPYTDYDVAMLWHRELGKPIGAKLLVAVCYEGEELVGLIPFEVRRRHGARVLFLLGHETYYYRNFLMTDPCYAPLLWQAVLDDDSYDLASLKDIHEGSPDYIFLSSVSSPFRQSFASYCEPRAQGREALSAAYPKYLLRKIKKVERLQKESGEVEIGCSFPDQSPPDDVVDFLVERKAAWVAEGKRKGIFTEENGVSFFKKLVCLAVHKKAGALFWMRRRGALIGAGFCFIEGKTVYGHVTTYDPAAAELSPGNMMSIESIVWASGNGYTEVNFMEGEELYKSIFATGKRGICDFLVGRTFRGKAHKALFTALTLYREAKRKWQAKRSQKKG